METIKIFNEIWSRWDPGIEGITGNYYVTSTSDDENGFIVILEQEGTSQRIEVLFSDSVSALRLADEGVVFMLFDELYAKYGDDFYTQWTFFKVENSDCLQWLSSRTAGFSERYNLKHFVIMGLDKVLDIVASYEPKIRILTK